MNSAQLFDFNTGAHLGYLLTAHKLLIEAYNKLITKNYNATSCNENKIRDDLVKIAQKQKKKLPFRWTTELPDLEKNNRIDIALITPHTLDDTEKVLKIECKIVGEREYVNKNGISSFTSGKYASEMPLAGMVGFIKKGNVERKINKIKENLDGHETIKTIQNLTFYNIKKTFEYSYISRHCRDKMLLAIDLYHLFFDFTLSKQQAHSQT